MTTMIIKGIQDDWSYQFDFGEFLKVDLMFKYQRVTSWSPTLHSVHATYTQCTRRLYTHSRTHTGHANDTYV